MSDKVRKNGLILGAVLFSGLYGNHITKSWDRTELNLFQMLSMYSLGSCRLDEIAWFVLAQVIEHYQRRNQLLIDCGFLGLTKQRVDHLPSGCVIFRDDERLK